MTATNRSNYIQFKIVIFILGLYLLSCQIALYPYIDFIYGPDGVIKGSSFERFSNIMLMPRDFVYVFFCLSIFLLFFEKSRQIAAVFLLFYYILLFNINPFSVSPEVEFVNFLLLCIAAVPRLPTVKGFDYLNSSKEIAWIILGVGYLSAGSAKFLDVNWRSGELLNLILAESPVAGAYSDFLLTLGHPLLVLLNYSVIFLEIIFCVSIFFKKTRFLFWVLMTSAHIMILMVLRLEQVSIGMIVYHSFIIDQNWLIKNKKEIDEKSI